MALNTGIKSHLKWVIIQRIRLRENHQQQPYSFKASKHRCLLPDLLTSFTASVTVCAVHSTILLARPGLRGSGYTTSGRRTTSPSRPRTKQRGTSEAPSGAALTVRVLERRSPPPRESIQTYVHWC